MNINEAKAHLSDALAKVAKGETVVLCKRNKPVAEIRPIRETLKKRRPIGLAAKKYPTFSLGKDFFEPLPDDLVNTFLGENT
jgi:prevent-host-death family protein